MRCWHEASPKLRLVHESIHKQEGKPPRPAVEKVRRGSKAFPDTASRHSDSVKSKDCKVNHVWGPVWGVFLSLMHGVRAA